MKRKSDWGWWGNRGLEAGSSPGQLCGGGARAHPTSLLSLPAGKEGTTKIAAGAAGTALLRSKKPMLEALKQAAQELVGNDGNNMVVASESQLTQANVAKFTESRIQQTLNQLSESVGHVEKQKGPDASRGLEISSVIAGAYTAGITLETINSLLKLFGADQQVDIFDANAEAQQLFGIILIDKGVNVLSANPVLLNNLVLAEAEKLMGSLDNLGTQILKAKEVVATASEGINEQTKQTPLAVALAQLKERIEDGSAILSALHPAKNPDGFWAQALGQAINTLTEGKKLLFFEVRAQVVQNTVSRWFWSQQLYAMGEVHVTYRIVEPGGTQNSGSILRSMPQEPIRFGKSIEYKTKQ